MFAMKALRGIRKNPTRSGGKNRISRRGGGHGEVKSLTEATWLLGIIYTGRRGTESHVAVGVWKAREGKVR